MVRHHISLSFLLLPLFMEYHMETVSQCLSCAIYLRPEIFQNFSILSNKNWEWTMFYSSILNKLSVFVQLSSQIQTHSSYFENSSLNSANFTDRVLFFALILKSFYPSQKIFVTFVINSKAVFQTQIISIICFIE